jgi:hypothetical protein
MSISAETKALIQACLAGDPALASLAVVGTSSDTLSAHIAPGRPPNVIGGSSFSPHPPFHRETLVELIVRMQRLRWNRSAPFNPKGWPPEDRDLQALHKKHGKAVVGIECGPGWTDLLDATFAWLHGIAPDKDWAPTQIKEKFGTLRFYWFGDLPDFGDEIISAAEHVSAHICEMCGAEGHVRKDTGWWSVRCRDHGKESSS